MMESNQYDETKKKGNFMKNVFCVIYMLIQTVL